MSRLDFLDSAGVGALIACLRTVKEREGDFRLCALSRPVRTLFDLMRIDQAVFGSGVAPMRAAVEFGDGDHADPRQVAETVNLIALAQAASIETKVRMLHPEWEKPQVDAEVEAIRAEQGLAADPTGGLP